MPEPMSDNQQVFRDVHGKIVEIVGQESIADAFHRLQAENAAMREIVQQVINVPPYEFHDNTDCFFHGDCYPEWVSEGKGYWKHHPECLVTKARALCAARR